MTAPAAAQFRVEGLSKRFLRGDDSIETLRDISFEVAPAEFVAIVGPSGCGKTTLLRILHGLLAPTAGKITIDGRQVVKPTTNRAIVFQHDSLLPWRTVLDNVAFGLELQGVGRRTRREKAREFLKKVNLGDFAHFYPYELSGGMRQRVNLARALAIAPEVLLMDEPFAALDGQTRELMQAELLRVWSLEKRTVVFVTHQIDEAVFLADRVLVLTARPGMLRAVVDIEIKRPRDLAVKHTPEFIAYVDEIWGMIRGQAQESLNIGVTDTASKASRRAPRRLLRRSRRS